jgi:hypothetical protein
MTFPDRAELAMAAVLRHLDPAIRFDRSNHLADVHPEDAHPHVAALSLGLLT